MKSNFKQTIDWYDAHAETYHQNSQNSASLDLLEQFTHSLPKNAKVLDAGCASGRDSKLLAQRGFDVVGVDISTSLIALAKEKNPSVTFVVGSFLDLPFEDDKFDGVWAHASLLHFETIEDVMQSLREFHRVLKHAGILHVYVKQQVGKEKTSKVADTMSNGQDRFFQWFTKGEVEALLNDSGFEIIFLEDNYIHKDSKKGTKWVIALGKKR